LKKKDILDDSDMKENDMNAIRRRVAIIFANKKYRSNVEKAVGSNWMRISVVTAFGRIEEYLKKL